MGCEAENWILYIHYFISVEELLLLLLLLWAGIAQSV
jgi:hypothetical protein